MQRIDKMNIKNKFLFVLPMLLLITGCDLGEKQEYETSDAELIQMIIESDKVDIDILELPEQSRTFLDNEIEYEAVGTRYASELGYEVERIGNGHKSGHRGDAYFNLEGRKLDPNDWGRKGRGFGIEKEDWQCFTLVFPISFELPDGSSVTVDVDDEESWAEIKSWYDANPDSDQRPTMQFPVVIFFDEESMTIDNQEEMRTAYEECYSERKGEWSRDDESGEACFELVYPITFTMPDGSSMTVQDDEDGWSDLKNWYDENEGYEEVRPEMQYPVDITYTTEEGTSTTVTISNEEEMVTAKLDCRGEGEESDVDDQERECFEYVLPVTFVMPDGSTITVEDEDGWYSLRRWYEQNGESEEEPGIQYPVDIMQDTEQGSLTFTINSDEEMEEAYANCSDES